MNTDFIIIHTLCKKIRDYNLLYVVLILIAILFIQLKLNNIEKIIQNPKYKVYYEYNVINNDTIAVDTVYVKQ